MVTLDEASKNTARSNELLAIAKRYAEEAESLNADDPRKIWLENEAARFINDARELTARAKARIAKEVKR